MRPIIYATWSKNGEKEKLESHPPPPSPPTKSSPPSSCFRRRTPTGNSFRAHEPKSKRSLSGDAGEKAEAEKSGKEQIAEQTLILRSINDNLIALKEQTERNATTNAAVLVLLTHVLKGESLENGDRAASEAASLLSNSNQGSVEKIPAAVDSDSKSLASDADIPEKISECSENESAGVEA